VAGYLLGTDELRVRSDNAIIDTIRGVSDVSGALTVVGLVGMLWSASAMFGAIRKSLNIAWDVETFRPVVRQKLVDLGMVLGIGVLLGASIAGTGALRTLRTLSDDALGPLSTGTGFFWSVMPFVLPAFFSFAVFLLLYRYVPSVQHTVSEVLPGALFATLLFELLKNGFALYVANFNNYAGAYGALGGVLLFLLWTYVTANILLIGAEVASEYERLRRGEPAPAPSGPPRSAPEQVWRFLRGLVFHEHELRGDAPRDDAAAGSGSDR
jgi:membrane protein